MFANNKIKKIISLIILCVTLISVFPLGSYALNTDEITLKMNELKASAYPDGWFWCGGDPYKSISYSACGSKFSCFCNSFAGGYQCHGFALMMAQRTVGSYPAGQLASYRHGLKSNGWTCYTSAGIGKPSLCAMGLRPGDIIRASNTANYSDGHTAIVWKVENGRAYFAESWGHAYSKIKWGAFNYSYGYSLESICAGYTYVALWRNDSVTVGTGQCPHNYKIGSEANHPHREYKSCIYCQKTEYTGNYVTVQSCVCCNGTHDYAISNESIHPHKEIKTCRSCGHFVYSGNTTVLATCPVCQGMPYDLSADFVDSTVAPGISVHIGFHAENAVKYSVTVKKDGTKVASYTDLTGISCSFTPEETGTYVATVTAYSEDNKSLSIDTPAMVCEAPIKAVEHTEGSCRLTYALAFDREQAERFCAARGLTLIDHSLSEFTASAAQDINSWESEYVSEDMYTYVPLKLPYSEALDYCTLMGSSLASSVSAEIEAALVKLCSDTNSEGIILGSSDRASEGEWKTAEGQKLEYLNWNISATGERDIYKNYLFMFPGGTVTDCYATPGFDHGFVMKRYSPFSYSENSDGTLTLIGVSAIESNTLEIPAIHEGMTVSAIGPDAFARGNYGEVVIPDTISYIAPGAFAYANIESFAVHRGSAAHQILLEYQLEPDSIRIIFPFTDTSQNAWYYEGIKYCYENFYISGTSENSFSPNSALTREQFVLILAKVAGADLNAYKEADSGMTDVPTGQWYSSAIAWAVSEGYVSGVGEGIFGRGQNITREQLARLFYLYAEKCGMNVEGRADLTVFEDVNAVSAWAYENLAWAVDAGLISGMSATTLGARSSATRAQAARIFMTFDRLRG